MRATGERSRPSMRLLLACGLLLRAPHALAHEAADDGAPCAEWLAKAHAC